MGQPEILFITCPPWGISRPPLNIAYLTTYLKAQGLQADALDINIRFYNEVRDSALADLWNPVNVTLTKPARIAERYLVEAPHCVERFVDDIVNSGARYLGFSLQLANRPFTELLVEMIRARAPERIIIYGGPEVTIAGYSGQAHTFNADALVIGEGEETMAEAVRLHKQKGRFEPIPGLIVLEGSAAHPRRVSTSTFQPRPLIQDLDAIPFPTYEEFDLSAYHPSDEGQPSLSFLFSRGCINQCAFCMDYIISGRYRTRTAEHAVAEMEHHRRRHGISLFAFNDLLCNGNPKRLGELCDLIDQRDLEISWWSYATILKSLNRTLLKKLYRGKCASLTFGLESASNPVLKSMNKHYTAETAEEVIRNCWRAGILASINLIVGFPGETRREHQATMAFIKRNKDYIHSVTNLSSLVFTPLSDIITNPECYGIRVRPNFETWDAEDGNSPEERRRRLLELAELLERLEIPVNLVLGEPGWSKELKNQLNKKKKVEAIPGLTIREVKLFNKWDQEAEEFVTRDFMLVAIKFRVEQPLADPLFRVQIFNNENSGRHAILLFGMNTDRLNVRMGALQTGEGEIRLLIHSLNLLAGKYSVTVGAWGDEFTPAPYDVKEKACVFEVNGPPEFSKAKIAIPTRWLIQEQPTPGEIEKNSVESVDQIDQAHYFPREPLSLRARLAIARPKKNFDRPSATLSVSIRSGEYNVHKAFLTGLMPGRYQVELIYDPINLLEGKYDLEVELSDKFAATQSPPHRDFFKIRSLRYDGAGLVMMPCAWDIVRVPREQGEKMMKSK